MRGRVARMTLASPCVLMPGLVVIAGAVCRYRLMLLLGGFNATWGRCGGTDMDGNIVRP